MRKYKAGISPEVSARETRNLARARKLAAEGMVLLENKGTLPMALQGKRIALFGNGARHTIRGGTGSGEVNTRAEITVEQGLVNAGASIVTDSWLDRYDQTVDDGRKQYFASLQAQNLPPEAMFWMFCIYKDVPMIPLEDGDMPDADAALYILARNSGEGADRKNEPGDFQLSDEEKAVISAVGRRYGGVTVVLNVGGVIDTSFLRSEPSVNAVLLMSQTGSAGGDALADVLTGKSEPCGRLTTTWAERYEDYPNAASFSHMNGNIDDEYYTEGVFIGYRWFDSFGKTPAYPFGYGLSYADFAIETENVSVEGNSVAIKVRVRNTGSRPGREVVQVYSSAPQGNLPKPYQELRAFGKTRLLQPGEDEVLTLTFPVSRMASYDEKRAAWVLDAGEYVLRVGRHSRSTRIAAVLAVAEETITEQLKNVLTLDCEMEELVPDESLRYTYPEEQAERAVAPVIPVAYQASAPIQPVRQELPELAGRLTIPELAELCVGTNREDVKTIGMSGQQVPGAAGETQALPEYGVGGLVLADGPAGLRLCPTFSTDPDGMLLRHAMPLGSQFAEIFQTTEESLPENAVTHYQYCTAIPIATSLAQTWDLEAVREAGDIVGEEMELFGVHLWLAPGMNIHRNPLCGRNFEYYSEDPLLSGLCAAADTEGVQTHPGCGTTIKHFCCNNQEDNRAFMNSHVSERALREIYLKGFEIAVKESQPLSLMTSYNLLNGTHTANSRDLLTAVLRDEWRFQGFVMTDWGTTGEPRPDQTVKYPNSDAEKCIHAGNDLTMPGSQRDVDRIIAAVEDGTLAEAELRLCAGRILRIVETCLGLEHPN